jgi:recombination DNA repair RAD52 pathway protein
MGQIWVTVNPSVAFLNCRAALELANEIAGQQPWNDEAKEIVELMENTLLFVESSIGTAPTK